MRDPIELNPQRPLSPTEIKGAFTRAKAILNGGWCQHTSMDPNGDRCLAYAIQIAHEELRPDAISQDQLSLLVLGDPLVQERLKELDRPEFSPTGRITLFNDHPLTTREDVLSLLERLS